MRNIKTIVAMIPKFLGIDWIYQHHEKMKKEIEGEIEEFQKKNPIEPVILIGSSCMVYMDYLIKGKLNDVDIYVPTVPREKIIRTKRVDCVGNDQYNFFIAPDYEKRLIKKDKFYCLSKEDLIVTMVASLTKTNKRNTNTYLKLLLLDADREQVRDLLELAYKNIKTKGRERERMEMAVNYFKSLYTDEYVETFRECQKNLYYELKGDE